MHQEHNTRERSSRGKGKSTAHGKLEEACRVKVDKEKEDEEENGRQEEERMG